MSAHRDGFTKRLPRGSVFGQRARLIRVARGRYFVPRSLDGGDYSLGVRLESTDATPKDPTEAREALGAFFFEIKEQSYVGFVGPILAELHIAAESWDDTLHVTEFALAMLQEHPMYAEERVRLLAARSFALLRVGRVADALNCIDRLLGLELALETPNENMRQLLNAARDWRSALIQS